MTRLDFLLGWWRLRRNLRPSRRGTGLPDLVAADRDGGGRCWNRSSRVTCSRWISRNWRSCCPRWMRRTPSSARATQIGLSVAVDGDTAVVDGASGQQWRRVDVGGRVCLHAVESGWILQQKLTAADAFGDDGFGTAVGISGESVVVGSRGQHRQCPRSRCRLRLHAQRQHVDAAAETDCLRQGGGRPVWEFGRHQRGHGAGGFASRRPGQLHRRRIGLCIHADRQRLDLTAGVYVVGPRLQ